MKVFIGVILILFTTQSFGQEKYYVFFKDKPHAQEWLEHPERYLSHKAIERRQKQCIDLHETDVPIYAPYIEELQSNGFHIVRQLKWLNAVVIEHDQALSLAAINNLIRNFDFIENTRLVPVYKTVFAQFDVFTSFKTTANYAYGNGYNQIHQMRGEFLHEQGFSGEGMTIAVIDGGFFGTDLYSSFDSLWMNKRVLATYNFVANDTNVFDIGSHGTHVLSVMAAFKPADLVGTAPRANYILLQSEDETKEVKQEEYNWIAAAEFADSAGADVINSSLGYNTFDGGVGDYTLQDMDGRTSVISKGAIWAHRKGLLVVNSMGNEGTTSWKKMLTPADTDSILSVGSTTSGGDYASFSGQGPTADGRLKPNVVARGQTVYHTGSNGATQSGSGTSFSSPLVCGLAACLWQINPSATSYEVLEAIEKSAHQYYTPDTLRGYGIPDFAKAFYLLSEDELTLNSEIMIFPVPFKDKIQLTNLTDFIHQEANISLVNISGETVFESRVYIHESELTLNLKRNLPHGLYVLLLSVDNRRIIFKISH